MNDKELKPCPFCGSEAKYGTNDGFHYIWCDDCGETIFGFSKKEAFDIWNTRVQCVDNEENCYYKNEENVVANGNYLEKQDSSKVNQSVQVPEVVENGNCKYLPEECCKKSCKDENATCKKNLQLTRSDIEKMVKLKWDEYAPNKWVVIPVIDNLVIEIFKHTEEWETYLPYINNEIVEDEAFETLEEAKDFINKYIVKFICSALGIKDLG